MAYWVGIIFVLIAAGLFLDARRHRAAALAERAERAASGLAERELHPSLSMLAVAAPFITMLFLMAFAFLVTLAFFSVPTGATWFDLVGFYALLAGYGYWLAIRGEYRTVSRGPEHTSAWSQRDQVAEESRRRVVEKRAPSRR
jgi:hypothetical protein